ncbi:DUF269 domain-containing protein [Thermicanus aegyptius]|uniref:DUF269 domain-containing protein n=1 Tax=Thermicanus aegyptius TaxID=94009 RepID=UPI0004020EEC|nr:DUF269 domain-containing protein [Thermicanus aegyptius]
MTGEERTTAHSPAFRESLVQVIDAYDTLSVFRKWTEEEKIKKWFLSPEEEKKKTESCGLTNEKIERQIGLFFQAVALAIEKRSGKMTSSMIEIDHEGMGRAIVYSGRTILINQGLRGIKQFMFTHVEDLMNKGARFVEKGLSQLEKPGI